MMQYIVDGNVVSEEKLITNNSFDMIKEYIRKHNYKLDCVQVGDLKIDENYEIALNNIEDEDSTIQVFCSIIERIKHEDELLNTLHNFSNNIEILSIRFYTNPNGKTWEYLAMVFDRIQGLLMRIQKETTIPTKVLEEKLVMLLGPMQIKDSVVIADLLYWEIITQLNEIIAQYKNNISIKES